MAINIPTKIPQLVGIPAGAWCNHLVAFFISLLEKVVLTRPLCFCFPTGQVRFVGFYQSALPPPPSPPPLPPRPPRPPPPPRLAVLFSSRPPPRLLLQFLLDHVCINFHLHFRLANSSPSSPQPGSCPAQCAPLDLDPGPAQLSVHRWTSTAR